MLYRCLILNFCNNKIVFLKIKKKFFVLFESYIIFRSKPNSMQENSLLICEQTKTAGYDLKECVKA